MSEDLTAKARGLFIVRTTSRSDGRPIGQVTYTFTLETQERWFRAGRWPSEPCAIVATHERPRPG